MGMDVLGKAPRSETGKYFRNNVWFWRPLADYCLKVAPDICAACEGWHFNDGDGLDAKGSVELAEALDLELATGRTLDYERRYREMVAALPNVTCRLCNGTGIRSDAVGVQHKMTVRVCEGVDSHEFHGEPHPRAGKEGWCNGCNGRGYVKHDAASYPFSAENVEEFVAFLRDCGGFEIC